MEKSDNINTVILGTGNILLGDEGIGVHTINRLKEERLPRDVLIVDGSTAGFRLISIFESYKNCKFIIIDALKITSGFPADSNVNSNTHNDENKKNNSIKDKKKSNKKGDIYSIPLKDFYNMIDSGCRSGDFISFHQTGLADVLKLLLLAYNIKIDGFLIGINTGNNSKQDSADTPAFSLKLTDEIEKKIPELIELVKRHI